jgi:phosphatidylglycerol:prolipoprotein diacylglycerol transferase
MATGIKVGPLTIRYYGIVISAGILAALLLTQHLARRREKKVDDLLDALPWMFLGGLLGARLWHILTPPESMVQQGITTRYYLTHLNEALAIWKGGVGIMGAILGGSAALWIYSRVTGKPTLIWLDILAPGAALAQAVGRWGNFINQEVYGLPANLPWAIYIEPRRRLPGYEQAAFYHPLFLYESLLSLLNMAVLLWLGNRYRHQLRPGSLFWIYLLVYGAGRAGLEFLRLDVSTAAGVNINQAAALGAALLSGIMLYLRQRDQNPEEVSEDDQHN